MRLVANRHSNVRLWIEYGLILLIIVFGTSAVSSIVALDTMRPGLTIYEKIVLMLPGCGNPP